MKRQKKLNNRNWLQILFLLLLAVAILFVRALGFKDRVLGLEEGERYFALCAQAGREISLWGYRLRELCFVAGSMVIGATVTWWLLGMGGAALTICLLGVCPNDWWILVLTLAWTVAFAWAKMIPVWDRLNPMVFRVLLLCASATFLVLRVFDTIGEVRWNEEQNVKMEATLAKLESVNAQTFLFNQPKYKDLLAYYMDGRELVWHEEADLDEIHPEYIYMIYEEGEWFADRVDKKYGFTYTDMGSLWFADLEESLHLLQVQWGKYSAQVRTQAGIEQILRGSLDGVLVPMFPMDNFSAMDFEVYVGSKLLNLGEIMYTGEQLVGALENILANTKSVQTVYVGLNQERMGDEQNWNELLAVIGKYPQTKFLLLLSGPQPSQLATEDGMNKWKKSITNVVQKLDAQDNAKMAYMGNQEWLFANENTFSLENGYADEAAREVAAKALMLREYELNLANLKDHIQQQETLVDKYRSGQYTVGEQSDKTILFLGDSIFGYTLGSVSIPGVVEYLTQAKTYNLGYGGVTATTDEERKLGAWEILQGVLTGDTKAHNLQDNQYLCQTIERLHQDFAWIDAEDGEKLVFVLNYGLNDYYNDKPLGSEEDTGTDTYLGAMRKVIEALKENYPQATVLVLTPNMVTEFDYGTVKKGPDKKKLEDFREAIASLADQLNIHCIQINEVLGLTKKNVDEYLVDGTHPNYYGNFQYGLAISKYLDQVLQ